MIVLPNKRPEMQAQVEAAYAQACQVLETRGFSDVLEVTKSMKLEFSETLRTTGGQATMRKLGDKYVALTIRLNARLLAQHPTELIPTFLHELAHIVVNVRFCKNMGHSYAWQEIAKLLGNNAERCHKMDVSAFEVKRKRYLYKCTNCVRLYKVSAVKHGRLLENPRRYRCRCFSNLSFQGAE